MKKVWVQIDPEVQKVVPVEPTAEMVDIAINCRADRSDFLSGRKTYPDSETRRGYRAMLSAAPTVPHLESADKVIHDACQSLMPAVQVPQKSDSKPIGEIEARALAALREVKEARSWSIGREALLYCDGAIKEINEILSQLADQKRAAAGEGK